MTNKIACYCKYSLIVFQSLLRNHPYINILFVYCFLSLINITSDIWPYTDSCCNTIENKLWSFAWKFIPYRINTNWNNNDRYVRIGEYVKMH